MTTLQGWMTRTTLHLEDLARRNHLSGYISLLKLIATALPSRRNARTAAIANYLVSSHPNPYRRRLLSRALKDLRATGEIASRREATELTRCIVAKPRISSAERGLLFVSFEPELEKLLDAGRFEAIESEYQIAFLPTWQPCYSRPLLRLAARARHPFIVMPAGTETEALASEHGPLCIAAPLQASSWSSASDFVPSPEKDIDLLMLANFSKYKRHWRLFEGLSQIAEPLRVVIAGRPWMGRDAQQIRAEAAAFGVEHRIEIRTDPSNEEVSRMLSRARVLCAMSHKEGSFIAVAEAILSDTPVVMYEDALIGSKAFINDQTGSLLDRRRPLGPQLVQALQRAGALHPREWAVKNIDAAVSTQRLNALLRSESAKRNLLWTQDAAAVHCRNFAFSYLDLADKERFSGEYLHLAERHGLRFKEFPVAN